MFISLRWTKQRKNKSVKNAKPKISAALNYRKKLVVKTNLSMRMNDIHALFMKKWSNKKYVIFNNCKYFLLDHLQYLFETSLKPRNLTM